MLFKAIIISMAENPYQAYITIPALDGSDSKNNFLGLKKRLATICSLPGCAPLYATGDVVYVEFEQDNMLDPVIIGQLYRENYNDSTINVSAESLEVYVNTSLSDDTNIGDVSYNNLTDINNNENQIDILSVSHGGTGRNSFTFGNYLIGNGNDTLIEYKPSQVRKNIEACKVLKYTNIIFNKNNWTLNSAGYYEQTISVIGLKLDYPVSPIIDCILSGNNKELDQSIIDNFVCINILDTGENVLIGKCIKDIPKVDIPIEITVFE